MLRMITFSLLLLSCWAACAAVAEDLSVLPAKLNGAAPSAMVHNYLMRLAREACDRRDAEFEKIKTSEDVTAYQQRMRQFFTDALGGFPERTPLRPQIVGKADRDGYRIEKIIFESQPRHYVTGILYLPDAKPPFPGVLVPCGHSDNGKAFEGYQRICILLAKNGLAAFCYDPIDQGERMQSLDQRGEPIARGTVAHCLAGVGSILLGRSTATYRVWDGMRAIDYLASRPEIDPHRIGCTGNSGGGTLTSYLMALDDRIACAAPSCYLTSLHRLCETIGPQDAEQNVHGQLAFGMDHAEYVTMRAPRPTLMCTATRDFFDISGSWDSFRQAKRIYTRQGFPERVEMVEADQQHGFTQPLRVATVRWMRRWLLHVDDAITEPQFAVAADKDFQCTPRGQVMLIDGARSVFDLNKELESQLAAQRKKLWQDSDKAKALDEVRRVTGIRRLGNLPDVKFEKQGTVGRTGYRIDKLLLHSEEGIVLPALAFLPEKPSGDACLYLHADGKQAHAAPGGAIEELVRKGQLVLAVDLRGIGETQQSGDSPYAKYIGPEWTDGFLAYLLDKSYLAMRAEDVLVCARFLAGYEAGDKPNRVHLRSWGGVGPPALHAAALEPQLFATVTLHNCLESWTRVVETPLSRNQFINVVHGGLRICDLPDLMATLPREKLTWSEPLDALEQPVR